MTDSGIDRRDFLKGAAATVALLMAADGLGVSQVLAADSDAKPIPGPEVKIVVIRVGATTENITTLAAKTLGYKA